MLISRTDFLADKLKPHRNSNSRLGNLRYYLTLPGIILPDDIIGEWGLLYLSNNRIIEVKQATYISDSDIKMAEWSILYSIARRVSIRGMLSRLQDIKTIKGET